MKLEINTTNQGVAAGPNPFYMDPEPRRLNTVEEVALEYVHDLRRANDALGKMAFQPAPHPDDALVAQLQAVRAKNTELEARNVSLIETNKRLHQQIANWEAAHPWDMNVRPTHDNPLAQSAREVIAILRNEIEGLRRANKGFADAAIKPKQSAADMLKDWAAPDPDGDCDKCPATDCDLNPNYGAPNQEKSKTEVAGEETYPGDAPRMGTDILARYAAQGEATIKAKLNEAAQAAAQRARGAAIKPEYTTKPGNIEIKFTENRPDAHKPAPQQFTGVGGAAPNSSVQENSDPYYKAPKDSIDGDKAIRQARENLEAFKRDLGGDVNPRAG